MIVVSDTTPIISLLKINRLDLLEKSFGEVLIPNAVYEELTVDKRFIEEAKIVRNAPYIKSVPVANPEAVKILKMATGLDQGESEAIVLTDERKADILLMDEAKGRTISGQMGITIMGTIGLFVIEGVHGESFHRIDLVFLCDYLGKSKNATLQSDTNQIGFDWLDLSVLNRLPLFPSKLRRPIMNFYEGKEYTKYLGNEEIGDPECLE